MPIFDPREGKNPMIPGLILANLLPLVGIIYYDVSFFALFYLYWWETVMIGVFNWLKMGWAEKPAQPTESLTYNGKIVSYEQLNDRRGMRRMYFFMRSGIMIFYLIFIVVFVGLMTAVKEDAAAFAETITFTDPWVFWSFIGFTALHLVEYIIWVRSGTYKETTVAELANPFDGRLILIHVVIVAGTFLSMYTSEKLFPNHPHAASIGYGVLFVLIKIALDIWNAKTDGKSLFAQMITKSDKDTSN